MAVVASIVLLLPLVCLLGMAAGLPMTEEQQPNQPKFHPDGRQFTLLDEAEDAWVKQLTQPTQWYVPTGWSAWVVCSAVFVAGIDEDIAIAEDGAELAELCNVTVDYEDQSVTAAYLAEPSQWYKAIYRGPTLGCTLVGGNVTEAEIRSQDVGSQLPIAPRNTSVAWPHGDRAALDAFPPHINQTCVNQVVDADFAHPLYNTRSTLLIHNEQLIFERYRNVNARSPLLGWSMTKSLMSSLFGMIVAEGRVGLDDPAAVPEWHVDPTDPRRTITYRDMLQMASGIRYTESYDLVVCLYVYVDCARYYASLPSSRQPGTTFTYSTGNSYLLSWLLENNRGDEHLTAFEWPRERLFRPMQMDNALVEFTPFEYIGGGSLGYLTARDWARFGLLYMRKGDWFGNQLVPSSWVDFSCADSPSSDGAYGAHWWRLNKDLDPNICIASGFRKQNIYILPGTDLIVVRNAMPSLTNGWIFDEWEYLNSLLSCVN